MLPGRSRKSEKGTLRSPSGPSRCTVASNAAKATATSEGWVATQCSEAPKIAWVRLNPPIAAHPVPGWRLLQLAVTSRKYGQRVRCMMLPPMVAMLRSCAEALNSSACETTG